MPLLQKGDYNMRPDKGQYDIEAGKDDCKPVFLHSEQ